MSALPRFVARLRGGRRSTAGGPPPGMVPADRIAKTARAGTAATAPAVAEHQDPALVARRDELVERFALQQADLGGLYYEMAIRDHIRADVLAARAAELQRVDIELAQVERILRGESVPAGNCPACGAAAARGDVYCSQCAHPLHASGNGAVT